MSRKTNRNRSARLLQEWSGRELLRLFLEQSRMWRAVVQCPECGFEAVLWPEKEGPAIPCIQCGGGVCAPLDEAWWARAAERIRRACLRDRTLLPTVKDEWEEARGRPEEEKRFGCEAPRPRFPAELSWLTDAWEKAAKPGRPFGARMHYRRAHVYDRLHAARVSSEKIAGILTDPSPKSRQRRYDALPESVHQFLGDFRNQIQSVDYVSGPVELRRSIQWARRQWSSPEFRLTGERVRTRRRARRSARLAGRAIRPAKEMTRPRLGVH